MSLCTLTAPSGTGKTTSAEELIKCGAISVVSYTTREPHKNDLPGEYQYITHAEFQTLESGGEFLWTAHIHGNNYGTRTHDIDCALESPYWHIAILTLSVLVQLYTHAQERGMIRRVKFFYLLLENSEELRRRLRGRGDSVEEIEARIKDCEAWNHRLANFPIILTTVDASRKPEEVAREIWKHTMGL